MIKSTLALVGLFVFTLSANAAIITVDHNITNLPPSGYLQMDLDGDGRADINLASNFYVSVFSGTTRFTTPYLLIGEVVDANYTWMRGNTWLDLYGNVQDYVQDDLLYLGVRNTTIGNYYGYITYNYNYDSDSVSLNSYTYDNAGVPITVAAREIPTPATIWLIGSAVIGLAGIKRKK